MTERSKALIRRMLTIKLDEVTTIADATAATIEKAGLNRNQRMASIQYLAQKRCEANNIRTALEELEAV